MSSTHKKPSELINEEKKTQDILAKNNERWREKTKEMLSELPITLDADSLHGLQREIQSLLSAHLDEVERDIKTLAAEKLDYFTDELVVKPPSYHEAIVEVLALLQSKRGKKE